MLEKVVLIAIKKVLSGIAFVHLIVLY